MNSNDLRQLPRLRPTQKHRLALIPGILGTWYAVSPAGEARYFDYDLKGAAKYASLNLATARLARPPHRAQYLRSGCTDVNPLPTTRCVWTL